MPTDFSTNELTLNSSRVVAGLCLRVKRGGTSPATELHLALSSIPDLLSANGAFSREPGASPQELKLPCKQALKARFNRADKSNESKSWRN
jgi:hypothetical protein